MTVDPNKSINIFALKKEVSIGDAGFNIQKTAFLYGAKEYLCSLKVGTIGKDGFKGDHGWMIDDACALKIIETLHMFLIEKRAGKNPNE